MPEDDVARRDFTRCLAQALEKLPEREMLVLNLYYRRQLSLKEIGAVLDLSESRICQIHAHAVNKLREQLTDWRGEV